MDALLPEIKNSQIRALYSLPNILERGKFSKSHLYNLISRGQFPKPALVLGPRFTRWDDEVDRWFESPSAWIAAHAESAVTP